MSALPFPKGGGTEPKIWFPAGLSGILVLPGGAIHQDAGILGAAQNKGFAVLPEGPDPGWCGAGGRRALTT